MIQQRHTTTFPTFLLLALSSSCYIHPHNVHALSLSSSPPPISSSIPPSSSSPNPNPSRQTPAVITPSPLSLRITESNNQKHNAVLTRRSILHHTLRFTTSAALASTSSFFTAPTASYAQESQSMMTTTNTNASDNREKLLQAIRSSQSDDDVLQAIQQLVSSSSSSTSSTSSLEHDLDGEWKLLWSIKADAFSPLLQLPSPFRPDSYQYFGFAASLEVGEGRVAQGLTGGILGSQQLWLSSGILPLSPEEEENDKNGPGRVLEIQPPFRLQFGGRYQSSQPKLTIVEAGSDADFRKVNARTVEAQNAPKNRYRQLYWESEGKGSLRISTITDGDPVIVGAVFVHEKL